MQISFRYYDRIREETALDKEGQVIIQTPTIPVKPSVRKYEREGEIHYIAYFSSKGKWTVRLHMEPEDLAKLIRKLHEAEG